MSTHRDRRVVITGLGVVSDVGLDVTTTWDALCAGRSGIGQAFLLGFQEGGREDLDVLHLQGEAILSRFLKQICQCEAVWTPANIVEDIIRDVRAKVIA